MTHWTDRELATVYRTWQGRGDIPIDDLVAAHVRLFGRKVTALALTEQQLGEVRHAALRGAE